MILPEFAKHAILRALDRCGYTLLTKADFERRQLILDQTLKTATGVPQLDYQVFMEFQNKALTIAPGDSTFHTFYDRVRAYTMTSVELLYALYKAVEYVVRSKIPGDVVECGVWRGGSIMMAALTLLALGDNERRLILFDTFAGHPKPHNEKDGADLVEEWRKRHKDGEKFSDWARVSLEEVRANIASTGFPLERVVFVQGMVEETLPSRSPGQVALLRLDTDWYESTALELKCLYPALSSRGVLILDDYGAMPGHRRAVDEFFAPHGSTILLNRVDFSGLIGIKT